MTSEDDLAYLTVKSHPVAGPILEALHRQDAGTYHGQSGDIAALAMATAATVDSAIRRDERHRLAQLLEDHRGTIADFAEGKYALYDLVVYLLRLDHR